MTNTYYSITVNGKEIARTHTLDEAKTVASKYHGSYKICYTYHDIDDTPERRERIAKNRENYYKKLKERRG